ncbi:MAG: CRISPR system precrRNA processing endoribonuclease RAMP protein Cas6 [Bryobacteraceae bacterium]
MSATFELYPLRFRFIACEPIHFPHGQSANILRGSFGRILKKLSCIPQCEDARTCEQRAACAYARLFEPVSAAGEGPSGLRDWPRCFVFRASHLDGVTVETGEEFQFSLNLFETREPVVDQITQAFAEFARKRAVLKSVEGREVISLGFIPCAHAPHRIRIRFLSATELKGLTTPEFGGLFARIRDRISTLRRLYGSGPLDIDFKALGERANLVKMTRCEIEQVSAERFSRRSGQTHAIGGFVGFAEYEGDLGEFLPYLEIARWTGVGRQTVWGKGEIACETY